MNLWLLALAALAAMPKVLGQDTTSASSSALQAVAEMPACAVSAFRGRTYTWLHLLTFMLQRECLATSITKSHCDLTNTTCVCTNPIMLQTMQACVLESCTIKQALCKYCREVRVIPFVE
jgi:hypothetical protein